VCGCTRKNLPRVWKIPRIMALFYKNTWYPFLRVDFILLILIWYLGFIHYSLFTLEKNWYGMFRNRFQRLYLSPQVSWLAFLTLLVTWTQKLFIQSINVPWKKRIVNVIHKKAMNIFLKWPVYLFNYFFECKVKEREKASEAAVPFSNVRGS